MPGCSPVPTEPRARQRAARSTQSLRGQLWCQVPVLPGAITISLAGWDTARLALASLASADLAGECPLQRARLMAGAILREPHETASPSTPLGNEGATDVRRLAA